MPRGKQTKAEKRVVRHNGGNIDATTIETSSQAVQASCGNSPSAEGLQSLLRKYKIIRIFEELVMWQYSPRDEYVNIIKRTGRNENKKFSKAMVDLPVEVQIYIQSMF